MPAQTIVIRFFLSSPGDVATERKIAREVLLELNSDPFIQPQARIEPVAWDDPASRTLMPVSLTPQQAIDQGLALPSECDAVITLLWGRMGTPLDVQKHGTKPNGEPYWSGTEWEFLDAVRGADNNPDGLLIVYLYRRVDMPPPPPLDNLAAMEQYVIQRKRVETFFSQFRDPVSGAYRNTIIEYHSPDEFRQFFEKDARLIVRRILEIHQKRSEKPTLVSAPPPAVQQITWHGSPFPGLRAFTDKDEPIFFGRGRETADLVKRLSNQRLMFVIGASGSGKSSLVGAGLIPQIRRGAVYGVADWQIARFTPGDAPFKRLAYALLQTIPVLKDPMADDDERAQQLAETLNKAPEKLAQQVEKWLSSETPGTELLLFIDQFEELFTTTPEVNRAPFAAALRHVSERIRTVVTMRADFYDRALLYFETALRDASYALATPSPIALYEMIVRPAEVTGLQFDPGLPERIVEATGDQPGGLALVAYLLEELYHRAHQRGDRKLTEADYAALGGVERAIATRAEHVYEQIDLPEARRQAALQRVFHELIEPTIREGEIIATRRRALTRLFEGDADARVLITAFVNARLLVKDRQTVEVAHEALLREWSQLAQWITAIADDMRLLRQYERDAKTWADRGSDPEDQPRAEQLLSFYRALENLERTWEALPSPLKEYTETEQKRLTRKLEVLPHAVEAHVIRRDIGDRLAVIGDTRPGVGVKDGIPDVLWLPVAPGGEITIEKYKFTVQPFFIAQYQITYAQYQAFVKAEDGFDNPEWWAGMPKEYQRQELADQSTKAPNNPRDSVSWYQSVAFARWLNHRLRGLKLVGTTPASSAAKTDNAGIVPTMIVGENAEIRLPTEWEWQWAAQGGVQAREYPWGGWQPGYANTSEAGLGRAIAVGMYPHGAAECGALDMAGGLWEWCLNDKNKVDQISISSREYKVLRGGSFDNFRSRAAASYRLNPSPRSWLNTYGLRLVVSSPVRL